MQLTISISSLFCLALLVLSFIHGYQCAQGLELLYIAPGYNHICAMFDNNKIKCFGEAKSFGVNYTQSLGDDLSEIGNYAPFIEFTTTETISKLVAGGTTTCALLDTGKVKCIGKNYGGQIGLGITDEVVGEVNGYIGGSLPTIDFGTELEVTQIALGYEHACALFIGNKIKCIGSGQNGELGSCDEKDVGKNATDMGDNLSYVDLGTDVEVAALWTSPTGEHTCATLSAPVSASQRLKCWGYNNNGQLGFGSRDIGIEEGDMGDNLPMLSFGAESRIVSASLGYYHTCAQLINYEIRCFGLNGSNQLAIGMPPVTSIKLAENTVPVRVGQGKKVTTVACGDDYTCFFYDDQLTVKCIGGNGDGVLGAGTKLDPPLNAILPDLKSVDFGTGDKKISNFYTTGVFSCAVFEDKMVKCFGSNEFGKFAIGNSDDVGDDLTDMGKNLLASVFYVVTNAPTTSPTFPTLSPTKSPTTRTPTRAPTMNPTITPSKVPTTTIPTSPTFPPTFSPTKSPSKNPSQSPITICKYPSSKLCLQDSLCTWKKKSCTVLDCTGLGKKQCKNESERCSWNKKQKTCVSGS